VTHRNIATAWSEGIESEVTFRPYRWLRVSGNSTLQRSWDETYWVPLDYMPDYTLSGLMYATGRAGPVKLSGQVEFRRVDARPYQDFTQAQDENRPGGSMLRPLSLKLSRYSTANISVLADFPKGISLTVTVQNALNANIEEASGSLAPGRFASMKLGYTF
jgi:outer membrane receptor protein involved in Fe transport